MAQLTYYATFDSADRRSAPRRYMWAVFAILFALMVVDYIDRQVVVSMFPHLKAQWNLSDRQHAIAQVGQASLTGLAPQPA
jgi:MFS transporter, Spinster family, sphingosine-1-phosphate transporter